MRIASGQDHYVENQNCPRDFLLNKNNRVLVPVLVPVSGVFLRFLLRHSMAFKSEPVGHSSQWTGSGSTTTDEHTAHQASDELTCRPFRGCPDAVQSDGGRHERGPEDPTHLTSLPGSVRVGIRSALVTRRE